MAKKNAPLPIGKLDSKILQKIVFDKITFRRDEVKVRPGIGEDCAIIDYGDYECVMSTDPITASVNDIGRLAIHISCNDVASNGVEPIGILLAVLLPVGTTEADVARIMEDAAKAAELCQVEIVGGHTEITDAVNKPVIVSTALGRAASGKSAKSENMKPGDYIFMTKYAGIEGTGIIASELEEHLRGYIFDDEIKYAKDLLDQVSVVPEGIIGGEVGAAAMHDITEGGVLGAVWEMCKASNLGCIVAPESIPVLNITLMVCNRFKIDYKRLISSGSMLMVVSPDKVNEMTARMRRAGIPFTQIGVMEEKKKGIKAIWRSGDTTDIEPPYKDELYRAYEYTPEAVENLEKPTF